MTSEGFGIYRMRERDVIGLGLDHTDCQRGGNVLRFAGNFLRILGF